MKLKVNVHLHTNDDPWDNVMYSLYEVVDHAAVHGFSALAITCHGKCAWRLEYADYAKQKGITLIRGIEANIREQSGGRKRHVLLLGVDKSAENIETFAELELYRKEHPDMLVVAPHPYFDRFMSLQDCAEKYIHLFDVIEHSWFYTKHFNRNKKALRLAKQYQKPVIATSDTHFLNFMADHYAVLDSEDATESSILQAIKRGAITNYTKPHRLVRDLLIPQSLFTARTLLWRLRRRVFSKSV